MAILSERPGATHGTWESEFVELLLEVRGSSTDLLLTTDRRTLIGPFLERGHIQECVKIEQLWLDAVERGEHPEELENRLPPDLQFILRFVLAVFSGIEPSYFTNPDR